MSVPSFSEEVPVTRDTMGLTLSFLLMMLGAAEKLFFLAVVTQSASPESPKLKDFLIV